MRRSPSARSAVRLPGAAWLLSSLVVASVCAGCEGRGGGGVADPDPRGEDGIVGVRCTANVIQATLACVPPEGASPHGGQGAVTIGDPGVSLLVGTRGVCFEDGCDPGVPAGVFQAEVTIRNPTSLAVGTADGRSADGKGVRVFFHDGPVAIETSDGRSGTVAVHNPDGVETYTAPGQPYFRYDGVLLPGEATEPKTWRWRVSPNVRTFRFDVLFSAEVAEPAPAEPFVVFDMWVDRNRDLYRVRLDGSDFERLTTSAADDREPSVAGDVVVFTSYRDGNAELYAMPLGVSDAEPVRLTRTAAGEREAALSPDGERLAYASDVSGLPRLWLAAADGRDAFPVTSGHGPGGTIEASPSWSPDGRRVVFVSTAGGAPISTSWMWRPGRSCRWSPRPMRRSSRPGARMGRTSSSCPTATARLGSTASPWRAGRWRR